MLVVSPGSKISLLLFFLFSATCASAQVNKIFARHGDNIGSLSCSGVFFHPTNNGYYKTQTKGAVWVKEPLDLRQPFSRTFYLDYLAHFNSMVDGGAFVLQPDTNNLGTSKNGMGLRGIKPSVGVTFDVFSNDDDHDPGYDHLSIQLNGNTDHLSGDNIAGPQSLEPFYSTAGGFPALRSFRHLVRVDWDPVTTVLAVYIDNAFVLSATNDLVRNVFQNNPIVYWGFTSSDTETMFYPPDAEFDFGYMQFNFGDNVVPRFATSPKQDSCFGPPILFQDASLYNFDSLFNELALMKYYWNFGDGSISTDRDPQPHQYAAPGVYQLKFTITNQVGCSLDTQTRKLTLGSKPTADFTDSGTCSNSPAFFRDASHADFGTPVKWKWIFDADTVSTEKNPVIIFKNPGVKNISLDVRTDYGCTAHLDKQITIGEKPVIDFNFTKNCDQVANFTAVVLNGVSVNAWKWDFGDGNFSGDQQPAHEYAVNGTYQSAVYATSLLGCRSDTLKKEIIADRVIPFAGNDTIVVQGAPYQLMGSGGTVYNWSPATGLDNPAIQNPVTTLFHDQSYVLTVKNVEGCGQQDTINIKVYKGPEIYLPNAFTPNGDGRNDSFIVIGPGIKKLNYLRIYNRWGQLIFESNSLKSGWDGTFRGSLQPSGTYVFSVSAEDPAGKSFSKSGSFLLIR